MKWLEQVSALTVFNLKTLPARKGSAAAAVVGFAGVVAVLVGVLSIGQGFRHTMVGAGDPDRALVLRAGADTEMTSGLAREETRLVAEAPGVARRGDVALASPELFVVINLPKRSTGTDANVPMRGVEATAFAVHDEVEIIAGRPFRWGTNEVIAGRAASREFAGLDVGSTLKLGRNEWQVVGLFAAEGGLRESEIWTDAAVLQSSYRRGASFQSVFVRLASAGSFAIFEEALDADPRLNVSAERETDYYAAQSRLLVLLVTGLGVLIAGLMGLAAVFGGLNTMYTAVAARSREIATLKALGFPGLPVVVSVLVESLLLALAGGTVGGLLAWAAFDGYRTATLNWQSFSQVAFAFAVTPTLVVTGIVFALFLGLLGGLLPGIRAARLPVAVALREG